MRNRRFAESTVKLFVMAIAACLGCAPLCAREAASSPGTDVPGVVEAHLDPAYWVARLRRPDAVLLDADEIAAQNARLFRMDPSMHDLHAMPTMLVRAQVEAWIARVSKRPALPRYDEDGARLPEEALDALVASLDLASIPASQPARYALVLRRAPLRTFPTLRRVFSAPGDTDLDRFQESALFPGTAVVVAHASRDGAWRFVVAPDYAAWIEARHLAEGDRDEVLVYADKTPHRVVTGAKIHTTFDPARPPLSELQLDMGVRLPLMQPADAHAGGQHAYASHVVELPVRDADGRLGFAPALVPKVADTAPGALPLTRANVLRQAFKFLGERYGWGHDYNARDCSGFVAEVYRSLGVRMPRNTGDQAASPAFDRTPFSVGDDRARRLRAVAALHPGDLVYVPGHVLMVIGRIGTETYVIHDIHGGFVRDGNGGLRALRLNGVSVTPLSPLRFDDTHDYIDRMTTIVRMARADG